MADNQYVAYVGTYTHGSSIGIHLYDMDIENGLMKERKVIPINNSSHITKSRNGKFLYSIADEGVEAFKILPDGDLEKINKASINGMRGCYLSTDLEDKYLLVSGYHDGKITVLSLTEDGSIKGITDERFHKGLGSVAERNFRPHVNCAVVTPDNKYICAVDLGVDHVKIYRLNQGLGTIKLVDFVRCPLNSAPRKILFSNDGRFAYLISELSNTIDVYFYDGKGKNPVFLPVQRVSTLGKGRDDTCAASALKFSPDGSYLLCSNAGENNVTAFKVDKESGKLEKIFSLPISGEYPKDIEIFPDNRHIMSLNHESNTITLFRIDYEKGTIVLNGAPLKIETPNCALVSQL